VDLIAKQDGIIARVGRMEKIRMIKEKCRKMRYYKN
jgi:hypothetical protein